MERRKTLDNDQNLKDQEFILDIGEIFAVIFKNLSKISIITSVFALLAIIYSLVLTPVYRSEALLSPAKNSTSQSNSLLGGLSSIGGLIGADFSGESIDNSTLAIEAGNKRDFLYHFIKKRNLLVPILAAKDWDINSRNYSINENIYDINSNKWVFYDTEDPYEFIYYEAYLLIFDKIEIEEDRRTKIVKITLDHASPYIAKEWLDWLIFDLNEYFKIRDSERANNAINYLMNEIESNTSSKLDSVFSSLIEQQSNTLVLANSTDEYVFEILESPQVPIQRVSPRRTLIVLAITIIGGFFSVLYVLFTYWTGYHLTMRGFKKKLES